DEVLRDVRWGKVSVRGAVDDYGVVVAHDGADPSVDAPATEELRAERRARRTGDEPFFDRGPGYARLSGGARHADVDLVAGPDR
ncbi:MAG TPA: hydantoinase B/oxoprolinase family protein, partial [Actinomycetes bacterium]|nr:hydantoinase B/oxoprolinase family protein [Actinomycetes bacterium]